MPAKPFVVPVFIPHAGCPHRCVFCNQNAVTGAAVPEPESIAADITEFLQYRRRRAFTEIAFFGGNFLGLSPARMRPLLDCAAGFVNAGQVDGIRFSTRPDTVSAETLQIIAAYPVTTVELGVQSMDDRLLETARRGHSAADTRRAVERLKARNYRIGLQMMVGLPGEDAAATGATGTAIAGLSPDFVRIYPTLVIRGSQLARWHAEGRYVPLEMNDCLDRVKRLHRLFGRKNIPVIRTGLQANDGLDTGSDLIAGPYHPAFGQMVSSALFYDAAEAALADAPSDADAAILAVHPRRISTMRGLKNANIKNLSARFAAIRNLNVVPDAAVGYDELRVRFPGFEGEVESTIFGMAE